MEKRQKNQKIFSFSILKKSKKGSHVGFVLSFVIFITFLLFIYTLIDPTLKIRRDKQSLLNHVERELIERISAEITVVSIALESPSPNIVLGNFFEETGTTTNLFVKNGEGTSLVSRYEGGSLYIANSPNGNDFFKIYVSDEFDDSPSGVLSGSVLTEGVGYTLGLIKTDNQTFETKIIELIDSYAVSYDSLKGELNLPSDTEFGFGFEYENKTLVETEEPEVSTNIYAKEISIQYVDGEANIKSGFLRVKIW